MTSVADRAANLVLAGFDGTIAAHAPLDVIRDLAGVILFARNIVDVDQTIGLVRDLQAAASAAKRPLIVAIDEEGGTVSRIGRIGTTMPSAMALGAAGDSDLTRSVYRAMGEEAAALGITLDFAPVADANIDPQNPVIGVRSFGKPSIAAEHVRAAIAGLHDASVGATAKHFPGHGDTSVDSHRALPTIDVDLSELHERELMPFRAAIEAGVDAVMTAHIALPRVDPSGAPATLSRPVLTGLLREELGFEGVICTDCLQMDAIANSHSPGEAAVLAIAAGADLVAFSSSMDAVREAIGALRDAIAGGRLDPGQIERSLERIDALRTKRGTELGAARKAFGAAAHHEISLSAARRAVTIVRDPLSTIPLKVAAGQKIFLVQFDGGTHSAVESSAKQSTAFGKLLARGSARVQEQIRTLDPAGHEYKQLLMAAASADAIVAVTRRAWAHPLQAQAVGDLALAGKPLVVIAAREPYDATIAPSDAAVVATFGDDASSMEAAADVLLGKAIASGHLPVEVAQAAISGTAGAS